MFTAQTAAAMIRQPAWEKGTRCMVLSAKWIPDIKRSPIILEKMIPRSSKRMNSVLTKGNTARPISMIESHQIITLNNIPPPLNAFFICCPFRTPFSAVLPLRTQSVFLSYLKQEVPRYCSEQKLNLKYITGSADFTYKTKKPGRTAKMRKSWGECF